MSPRRFKTLQSNVEKYKLEIAALGDKNSRYCESVAKHETTVAMLRDVSVQQIDDVVLNVCMRC